MSQRPIDCCAGAGGGGGAPWSQRFFGAEAAASCGGLKGSGSEGVTGRVLRAVSRDSWHNTSSATLRPKSARITS